MTLPTHKDRPALKELTILCEHIASIALLTKCSWTKETLDSLDSRFKSVIVAIEEGEI